MKKILFICSTLNTGGAQKILSNILMNLPEGYEADILLNNAEDIVYSYKGKVISLGFKRQKNMRSIFYQTQVFIKRIFALIKLKKTGDYIAAVSFMDSANIANIVSGNRKCRTVISVHTNLKEAAKSWIYKYLVNPLVHMFYEKADVVVAVSLGIKHDLINHLGLSGKNIVTIYNGQDIEEIKIKASQRSINKNIEKFGNAVITTMGRMSYPKGQWHLIRALTEVKKIVPHIQLLILGEGELEAYLKKLVHECHLEKNVIFCGFRENPFEVIAQSDLFVLPSMYEGLSNALVEALACEVPCVATDFHSGAREILEPGLPVEEQIHFGIIEGEYGILVPVCDGKMYNGNKPLTEEEKTLAEAIIRMLGNKELQKHYKKKAQQVVKKFTVEEMTKKWLEVIEG